MKNNPYTLSFGKLPNQLISRSTLSLSILDDFRSETPSQQLYLITGVRGSGKTVLLSEVSKSLKEKKDWIVVELNPELNLLESLVSKLYSEKSLSKLFKEAKLNFSFFGFGLEVSTEPQITDIETALIKMLNVLKKKKKRLLITIDEASNTKNMKVFVSTFQILIRNDLPVFLLMTGLYDNIQNLQNEKNLTFLYRAPKIELQPLNIRSISENYKNVLNVDDKTASEMAKLTKGYSFAFQVLGYLAWENNGFNKKVLSSYKQYLEDYVYEKIWSELSMQDRVVANAIARSKDGKISDIRKTLNYENNQFNPYRKRLIKKGLINGDTYGYVSFVLPLFDEYVKENDI